MFFTNEVMNAMIYVCSIQLKDVFADGKDLVVTVMSSMGEEQICALKDISKST